MVGLRQLDWTFVRPLYPDTPFFFTTETDHTEPLNDRFGLVNSTRRVFGEDEQTLAIGRMSVVMLRRAARPENAGESG